MTNRTNIFAITGEGNDRTVVLKVDSTDNALLVNARGMRNAYGNPLLALDLHEGKLRLFIWGKRDGEEYTHVLNLDNGKIEECYE